MNRIHSYIYKLYSYTFLDFDAQKRRKLAKQRMTDDSLHLGRPYLIKSQSTAYNTINAWKTEEKQHNPG